MIWGGFFPLWESGIKICDSQIISSEWLDVFTENGFDINWPDWKGVGQQWCVIIHTLPEAVLEFSAGDGVWFSLTAVLCHREMQDQIRPWLMWLKWTQRCQRKVAENWLLETLLYTAGEESASAAVTSGKWMWRSSFFCTWKMMVPRMFWSCQQLGHLFHRKAVESKGQIWLCSSCHHCSRTKLSNLFPEQTHSQRCVDN